MSIKSPPMVEFVFSFLRDILVISIVFVGLRGLNFLIQKVEQFMPLSGQSNKIDPYLGMEMTHWMVTMMDVVAMASIMLISFYTIIKHGKDLFFRFKLENQCFEDCPHEEEIVKKIKENTEEVIRKVKENIDE